MSSANVPSRSNQDDVLDDDPICRVYEIAGSSGLGSLSNEQIDAIVYGFDDNDAVDRYQPDSELNIKA